MRLSTCVVATAITVLLAVPATNPTAAAAPWCGADSLSLSTTPPIYPTSDPYPLYIYFSVLLTNTSGQTCTLQGYPGVDLVGPGGQYPGVPPDPANPPFSGIVHASRTGGGVQPITLPPGATATSRLGFMPKTTSSAEMAPGFLPTTVVVTPPDTTTQLQTPWPSREFTVLLIGDGTKPFVTIDPLQPYS